MGWQIDKFTIIILALLAQKCFSNNLNSHIPWLGSVADMAIYVALK